MIDFIKLMDPKKANSNKLDELFESPEWIQEKKINGRRMQCMIQDSVSFAGRYGRNANENISQFPDKFFRVSDDIKNMNLPNNTLLDGELHIPGRSLSETLQVINSANIDDAIILQERYGFLVYEVFDIMYLNDKSLMSSTILFRKKQLQKIIQNTLYVNLVAYKVLTIEKKKNWKEINESTDEEKGVVFKFSESEYECQRSKWWQKLKTVETFDAVIMGFKLHKTNPDTFISSIIIGQYDINGSLKHVADVGSLTKEEAAMFRDNMEKFTGKVIQFKADSRTISSYKNPRFDCLRLDKLPQDCIWEV